MRLSDALACVLLLVGSVPSTTTSSAADSPHELRVVTYNVLADPILPEQRAASISQILEDADADIIALQEVTSWFAEYLLREHWVQDYHCTRHEGRVVIAHEFLILSRFPILTHHTEPLSAGVQRRVLHSITIDVAGEPLVVATCHLESLLDDGPVRAQQLDQFFAHLASAPEALFLGDFNFGDGETESDRIPRDFRDAWQVARPSESGYTWDRERSAMARRESLPRERSRRIDRVLIKSPHWHPIHAVIVGDEPVPQTNGRIFPSDHFGVLAVLRRPAR